MGNHSVETGIIHDLDRKHGENASLQPEKCLEQRKKLDPNLISSTTKTPRLSKPSFFKRKQKKNTIILLWRETPCRSCEACDQTKTNQPLGLPGAAIPSLRSELHRVCHGGDVVADAAPQSFYDLFMEFLTWGKVMGITKWAPFFLGGQVGGDLMEKNKVPSIQSHDNSFESIMSQHHASALIFS